MKYSPLYLLTDLGGQLRVWYENQKSSLTAYLVIQLPVNSKVEQYLKDINKDIKPISNHYYYRVLTILTPDSIDKVNQEQKHKAKKKKKGKKRVPLIDIEELKLHKSNTVEEFLSFFEESDEKFSLLLESLKRLGVKEGIEFLAYEVGSEDYKNELLKLTGSSTTNPEPKTTSAETIVMSKALENTCVDKMTTAIYQKQNRKSNNRVRHKKIRNRLTNLAVGMINHITVNRVSKHGENFYSVDNLSQPTLSRMTRATGEARNEIIDVLYQDAQDKYKNLYANNPIDFRDPKVQAELTSPHNCGAMVLIADSTLSKSYANPETHPKHGCVENITYNYSYDSYIRTFLVTDLQTNNPVYFQNSVPNMVDGKLIFGSIEYLLSNPNCQITYNGARIILADRAMSHTGVRFDIHKLGGFYVLPLRKNLEECWQSQLTTNNLFLNILKCIEENKELIGYLNVVGNKTVWDKTIALLKQKPVLNEDGENLNLDPDFLYLEDLLTPRIAKHLGVSLDHKGCAEFKPETSIRLDRIEVVSDKQLFLVGFLRKNTLVQNESSSLPKPDTEGKLNSEEIEELQVASFDIQYLYKGIDGTIRNRKRLEKFSEKEVNRLIKTLLPVSAVPSYTDDKVGTEVVTLEPNKVKEVRNLIRAGILVYTTNAIHVRPIFVHNTYAERMNIERTFRYMKNLYNYTPLHVSDQVGVDARTIISIIQQMGINEIRNQVKKVAPNLKLSTQDIIDHMKKIDVIDCPSGKNYICFKSDIARTI